MHYPYFDTHPEGWQGPPILPDRHDLRAGEPEAHGAAGADAGRFRCDRVERGLCLAGSGDAEAVGDCR